MFNRTANMPCSPLSIVVLIAATIFLSGCANHPLDCALDFVPHDDCLPGTAGYDSAQKRVQKVAAIVQFNQQDDDTTCKSYGLKFGTPEYAQCREHMLSLRVNQASTAARDQQDSDNARRQAYLQYLSKTQQTAQENKPQPYMIPTNAAPYVMPASTNTNCTAFGNSINCQTTR